MLKKVSCILFCVVSCFHSNTRSMDLFAAARLGAYFGGGIPAVFGIGYNAISENPLQKKLKQWGIATTFGTFSGGVGGVASYALMHVMLANPVTYTVGGAVFLGTLAGCGTLCGWTMVNFPNLYPR